MDFNLNTPAVANKMQCLFCVFSHLHLERSHESSFVFADTHALVSLLQNLNKANYQLPIMVTDSGKPPMTNITDLRVQVCSCKNSKVDCNAAGTLHFSLTSVLLISLFSVACKLA